MSSRPAAEHPSPVTPQSAVQRFRAGLDTIATAMPLLAARMEAAFDEAVDEAADAARKEVLDEIRANMPAAVLATDGGPAVAYAMRVTAFLDSLARPVEEERK